ncbi:MAG: sulfatase [Pirellulaceae bacterium]
MKKHQSLTWTASIAGIQLFFALFAQISPAGQTSSVDQPRNILLICIDDLRPELGCYGVEYVNSPNIDRFAAKSRRFNRHYVQAPTCGASRYTLLTGRYGPRGNEALFQRAERMKKSPAEVPPSIPEWFRQHGYRTVSVGKVSHHPGGRGGSDWDDQTIIEMPNAWDEHLLPAGPWQHPRGAMHGLANGEIRGNAKQMDLFQSVAGEDDIYPDGLIVDTALDQLDRLAGAQEQPFLLAVGIIRPHLPFGAPAKYMAHYRDATLPPTPRAAKPRHRSTWHGSGEFMKYNRWGRDPNEDAEFAIEVRKHYAACVSYADAQVGKLLQRLRERGLDEDTVVVLWGDHGWHLGEHAVWGKHTLFEESLRSPLLIHVPGMVQPGAATDSIVETLDIFPTLCDVAGIPAAEFTQGVSLQSLLQSPSAPGHPAIAYAGSAETIRTEKFRIILHKDGFAELYSHEDETPDAETTNIAAAQPEVVADLSRQLQQRLGGLSLTPTAASRAP